MRLRFLEKSKKIFIQQPYFLPWLGFFAKIYRADHYIALDNAPFRRNHFHRSAILGPSGKPLWLTCPVGANRGTPMSQIKLPQSTKYIDKFLKTIINSYAKAVHFEKEFPIVNKLLNLYSQKKISNLADINLTVISELVRYFELKLVSIERESSLILSSNKNIKTIEIMDAFGGNCLICGDGGSTKIHDIDLFYEHDISIEMLECKLNHPEYCQLHSDRYKYDFVSGLSFIDALLNVGRDSVINLIKYSFN